MFVELFKNNMKDGKIKGVYLNSNPERMTFKYKAGGSVIGSLNHKDAIKNIFELAISQEEKNHLLLNIDDIIKKGKSLYNKVERVDKVSELVKSIVPAIKTIVSVYSADLDSLLFYIKKHLRLQEQIISLDEYEYDEVFENNHEIDMKCQELEYNFIKNTLLKGENVIRYL